MERVRITLSPPAAARPPVYELLTRDADPLSTVEIVNWNVATPPASFLLRLVGDYEAFADRLADHPDDFDSAILPLTDRTCYCFLSGTVDPAARALFKNFTQGSLLTVPPVACHDDGSSTFTIVGTADDVQAAVDGVPDDGGVTVDEVGGDAVASESVVAELAERQREAVSAALELGYYTVPRDATIEDVADALDCGTATAAEHLRKAEGTAMRAMFRERDR